MALDLPLPAQILLILAEVAVATNDAAAVATVKQWLAETHLEYPAVEALVSGRGGGAK